MTSQIKIIIADDHNLVRQSIAIAIGVDDSLCVSAQADNGRQLLELMSVTEPDVVLLDLEMPVMNGWDALDHIKSNYPKCKVIVLSMHFENLFIRDLVARGAHGFLPKHSDFETLISAIHDVIELGYYFSETVSKAIVKELLVSNAIDPRFKDIRLSDKERETLLLVCDDKLTKEIASILDVSERTVERYKASLYEKTRAKTSAGLVLYALKNHIISLGS